MQRVLVEAYDIIEITNVGQFLITKLGTKTKTRNRQTNSLELELKQKAWNYN